MQIIREYELYNTQRKSRPLKINALVTTYDIVLKDQAMLNHINWTYLAVDEAHRLKNNESMLHVVLDQFKTGNRLLITGTPLQNSIRELWSLLHFLQPRKFGDLDDFEEEYTDLQEQDKISNLHAELAPHILRRLKKDVEKVSSPLAAPFSISCSPSLTRLPFKPLSFLSRSPLLLGPISLAPVCRS